MASLPAIAQAAADEGPNSSQSVSQASGNDQVADLTDEVGDLSEKLESAETSFDRIIFPISVLISILAAGGLLGIVYSFRDQRRSSQIHELTVGGEIAAQRRSEQSYGSFFEQSQTTLSLVNDTLGLAKDAHDRAMQSSTDKARSRIEDLEERSLTLMMDVFTEEEFELIIDDPRRRDTLHEIAKDLRSMEGYLSLQDIELRQYTKFVKALDQFLLDDTNAAIYALRLAAQEGAVGELQRFIEYWLGYMLTTVGEYGEALKKFRHDSIGLKEDDAEYFQVHRVIAQTDFFLKAKKNAEDEKGDAGKTAPPARFAQVAELLDDLAGLAERLEASTNEHAKEHTRMEIARTRADVYEWVAYDSTHLDDPLGEDDFEAVKEFVTRHPKAKEIVGAREFIAAGMWDELQDPNAFRAWALGQARAICEKSGDREERSLNVEFALAECLFKLGKEKDAFDAFNTAERALHHEAHEFHEKRRIASIHQSVVICHCRMLKLKEEDLAQKEELTRRARDASSETLVALKEMRQDKVTIFSQIQRRNIDQEEFRKEVWEIGKQAKIWDKDQ